MVVAEVPLWVVHPGSKNDGMLKASPGASENENGDGSPSDHRWKDRAEQSLSLLETGGGGKCAIYSVDAHPNGTKFATGGGDGKVRIWNASLLLSKQRGRFGEQGNYESSDSSDNGGNESNNDAPPPLEESSSNSEEEDGTVNDLTSFVRRKSDGSMPLKNNQATETQPRTSSKEADPNSQKKPLSSTSPTKHHKHHHNDHHRLLCTLSAHTGSSVLAVRFSTNGKFLASAGDDACVCVYAPSKSSFTGGNLMDHSVEHWTRIKLCRGHTLDVVGLAWAPDDSHLVSCSLDSDAPIIVWKLTDLASDEHNNSTKKANTILTNPYKILGKGIHTSTVKGVTFDPAGTYLASSGDDPAVCVWRAHDDWGLERRVDASSGIFRSWNKGEEDVRELSSQTLFRRLSWSTDGAYICSTNATVKNKHVASTISREGWSVSSANSAASGAANLVGHKQPVVVSRHSPHLLDARKGTDGQDNDDDDDQDDEPEYATLIALGDKKGFVTVWSTRKSRPIFKLQCSESKRTVTDLAWGRVPNGGGLLLLVSLMDGHIVALRFGVPGEIGPILSEKDQSRVFQLRYGIDLDDDGMGGRRIFVGDNSGPKLIENALQFTLEEEQNNESFDNDNLSSGGDGRTGLQNNLSASDIKVNQLESRSKATGKKRIRPLLMSVTEDEVPKKTKFSQNGTTDNADKILKEKKNSDPMKDALESAAKAASAAEDINAFSSKRDGQTRGKESEGVMHGQVPGGAAHREHNLHRQMPASPGTRLGTAQIPHSTSRIHSVDLPLLVTGKPSLLGDSDDGSTIVADCTNSIKLPTGSSGHSLPCTTLSISRGGKKKWKDELYGTSCSAVAASEEIVAVGTADGCIYLYGTSPTLGWKSAAAFRSHPPIVVGNAVISLQLKSIEGTEKSKRAVEMLVVTSDGEFGVYNLVPETKLLYKGSILAPMTHMALSSQNENLQPRLARIQVTSSNKLLLLLSLEANANRSVSDDNGARSGSRGAGSSPSVGVGGSLQAFVYNRAMELWVRVSDSRFILSDFYSVLPTMNGVKQGALSNVDDMVRSGSSLSSLKPSHRGRQTSNGNTAAMYIHAEEEGGNQGSSNVITRAHCEDRMACALALGSAKEFEHWLTLFVRTLSMGGFADHLRLVVDLLLGSPEATTDIEISCCWWLSSASSVLSLKRKDLVKEIVIPEMSKNRALQRITNEVSMEINSL